MNPNVLRILDANFNRAREALRVVEDYARFVLDDARLSADLKSIRHDLAAATARHAGHALFTRDTPGDVGTANKTAREFDRPDLAAVVTAAGKRLGEALRTIEEYLKIDAPADAATVELCRYRFYDVEMRLARTLAPAGRFADVRLYVLITESVCRVPWLEVAQAAVDGGADCLQLREKELDGGELLRRAKTLVDLCRRHNVLCIINDRADVAQLADADGVHVGQSDLPSTEARKLLGPDKIVGVSTHTLDQARQAQADGADYIGVGPVFRSPTKPRDIAPGLPFATEAAANIRIPTVAIAGITEENLDQVLATNVRAIAITAAIAASDDPRAATQRIKARLSPVGQTFLSALKTPPANERPPAEPNPHGGADILVCPEKPSREPTASRNPLVGQTFLSVLETLPANQRPPASPTPPLSPSQPLEGEYKSYTRRLPHWRMAGATYFITFRVLNGELRPAELTAILDHVRTGDPKYYTLIAAVVMPDHAHLLLTPAPGVELSRIMQGTKGVTGKKVNDLRGVRGNLWQDESWDRIVRDQAELEEKIDYCMNNPVKKGLVDDPWDYPWWYYKPHRG